MLEWHHFIDGASIYQRHVCSGVTHVMHRLLSHIMIFFDSPQVI
jgi:hypothetical protein